MVRTGERLNLSTFGAVDDESKVCTLYRTAEWLDILFSNLGGNADSFRPMYYVWVGGIF